ncbi:hypothetical protein BSAJGB5T_11550 [Bacillus safensis]|nr:hypothetical protein BSAJGB5T_11550 [Bacillus safensis]
MLTKGQNEDHFGPLFSFQRDRKPFKSRKDEHRNGANLTFVSTGAQNCGRMRGFVYTLTAFKLNAV